MHTIRNRSSFCMMRSCGTLALGLLLPVSASLPEIAHAAIKSSPARKPARTQALDEADRKTLLLDRLTFGPTPESEAEIRRWGMERWLDRQLDPRSIDDSALERRLDAYPALRMTQVDRLQRYPEPATLRQMAKRGVSPTDPEARAILTDQVEFYEMARQNRQAKQDASTAANSPNAGATTSSMFTAGTQANPAQNAANNASVNLEQSVEPMPRPQVEAVLAMAPDERYGRLLSMRPEELIALRKAARGPLEGRLVQGMTPLQKETLLSLSGTNRMLNAETQGARVLRDVYSERQLEAVMTDFWLNHFNVFSGKNGQEPSLLPEYEKVVRAHALGKFEDLLLATAQSPAMLMYLDNATSVGPGSLAAQRARKNPKNKSDLGLNENYARELMELHTLGVDGGYTQQDVTEVAKVFTGWTLDRPYEGGEYNFNMNRHEPGPKTVLGKTIDGVGEGEGYAVLHMLATSPATARFVSTELAQRFVSDTPPQALVDRMAKAYVKSDGDVRVVLRTMVHSPEFFTTETRNAKLKTPLEYVVSAVRASGAEVGNPAGLVASLQQLGMPVYGCQPPTGYKWDAESWLSSSALINRMNFALALSTNRIGGVTVDWTPVLSGSSGVKQVSLETQGGDRKESLLEARLFESPVSAQTRSAVLTQGTEATAQAAAAQFANTGQRVLTDAEKQAQQQDRLDAMMTGRVKGLKGAAPANPRGLGAMPLKPGPPPADKQAAAMAGLLLGSPEFQRR